MKKASASFSVLSPSAILTASALAAAVLVMSKSELAAKGVYSSILMCGKVLIPSLFPILVISGILLRCGFPEAVGRTVGKPIGKLFGVSPVYSCAIVTGLICGFPTGAVTAEGIYRTVGDSCGFQRAALAASLASPSFVILGIGGGMLGSIRAGLFLWIIHIISAIISSHIVGKASGVSSKHTPSLSKGVKISPFICISQAVKDASSSMLFICGTVIFFSVPASYIASLSFIPSELKCILISLFELTSGATAITKQLHGIQRLVFLSFAVGWSGLSVHAQIILSCEGKLKSLMLICGKAVAAFISAALMLAAVFLQIL